MTHADDDADRGRRPPEAIGDTQYTGLATRLSDLATALQDEDIVQKTLQAIAAAVGCTGP